MTRILENYRGKNITYRLDYLLCTVGGIDIGDSGLVTPSFVAQVRRLTDNPMETQKDLKEWVISNWTAIKRSHFSTSLMRWLGSLGIPAHRMDLREFRNWEASDEWLVSFEDSATSGNNTSSFVLLSPEYLESGSEENQNYTITSLDYQGEVWHLSPPIPSENSDFYRILNYNNSGPSSEFLSTTKERTELYFGVELEISSKLSCKELQTIVTQMEPKQKPFFYFKEDSSISGSFSHKYEIVTLPATLSYQRKNWSILFKKIEKLLNGRPMSGFFDTSTDLTNGLHIHVSSNAFIYSRGDFHRRKFLVALNQDNNTFLEWLQTISKRPEIRNNYCSPYSSYRGLTTAAKMKRDVTSRSAAHSSGKGTVEVRVFQGIWDIDHVLSSLEFTESLFYFTQHGPYSSFNYRKFPSSYTKWLKDQSGYTKIKEVLCV